MFLEATGFPTACKLAGRYEMQGNAVTVTLRLARGKGGETFTVQGDRPRPGELAGKIVAETEKRLARP